MVRRQPPGTAIDAVAWHTLIAREFAAKYETSPAFIQRRSIWLDAIESAVRPESSVLDAGCGTGVLSLMTAARARHVLGIDASATMIEICRERKKEAFAANVDFEVLPLERLRVPTAPTFDVILCSSVLEYVENFWLAVETLNARLVPGGQLLFSVPNSRSVYRWVERLVFSMSGRPAYFRYVRPIPEARALSAGLEARGLRTLGIRHLGFPPLPTSVGRRIATHQSVATLALYTCERST